jgi:hypothetical protein
MLLPPDPPLEPLHHRDYEVRAFRKGPAEILLRGAVQDRKPGGLYIEGDTEPVIVHHMLVDLTVSFPELEIIEVDVIFEIHPQTQCPRIIDHYDGLVGLSIARGFTHRVRELFGGPRGCTHTTALLQAMAPVAVQCAFSRPADQQGEPVNFRSLPSATERRAQLGHLVNTCHVWAEDGELVTMVDQGETPPIPIPITERLLDRGLDPDEWRTRQRG